MSRTQKQIMNRLAHWDHKRAELVQKLRTEDVRFSEHKMADVLARLDKTKQAIQEQIRLHVAVYGCEPPDGWQCTKGSRAPS